MQKLSTKLTILVDICLIVACAIIITSTILQSLNHSDELMLLQSATGVNVLQHTVEAENERLEEFSKFGMTFHYLL